MFGFGKKDDKEPVDPSTLPYPEQVRLKYGLSPRQVESIMSRYNGGYGTYNIDYILEMYAPNLVAKVNNIEEACIWEGRYHESRAMYKTLLKRFDELQKNYNELVQKMADKSAVNEKDIQLSR